MKNNGRSISRHIVKWLEWKKGNTNSFRHKLLVLFGTIRSPSFETYLTRAERKEIAKAFEKAADVNCQNR